MAFRSSYSWSWVPTRVIGVVALVGVAAYACSGIRVIAPEEVGLVSRLGRLSTTADGSAIVYPPGLILALPPPIDEVIRVPVLREESVGIDSFSPEAAADLDAHRLMLTGDLALADVQMTVKYWITDAVRFVRTAADPRRLLERVVCSEAQAVMNRCSLDEVLRLRRERAAGAQDAFATIPEVIRDRADRVLGKLGCGISVTSIEIRRVQPPADVRPAFEALQTARIDLEAARERARGIAAERLIEADSLARQTVAEAEGLALARRAEVRERIALFEADLAQQGNGQRERMRREVLQRAIERSRKVVFVPDVPEGTNLRVRIPAQEGTR
jgi:membrane protease subunit HflK